jgi:hypothetical protein
MVLPKRRDLQAVSEPKRYALRLPEISYGTEESPNGEYVRYEDYASLKAEVERLTADNEQLQNRCDFLEGKQS